MMPRILDCCTKREDEAYIVVVKKGFTTETLNRMFMLIMSSSYTMLRIYTRRKTHYGSVYIGTLHYIKHKIISFLSSNEKKTFKAQEKAERE